MAVQPCEVFDERGYAAGMDHGVVPRRNGFAVFVLAGVPRRRDVSLRTLESDEAGHRRRWLLPDGIGACHMPDQRTELSACRVELEGNVIRYELIAVQRHPHAQWV